VYKGQLIEPEKCVLYRLICHIQVLFKAGLTVFNQYTLT